MRRPEKRYYRDTSVAILLMASLAIGGCKGSESDSSEREPIAVSFDMIKTVEVSKNNLEDDASMSEESTAAEPAEPSPTPKPTDTENMNETGETKTFEDVQTDYVVVVSLDGLNPEAIDKLGGERAPIFTKLMKEGVFTTNARAGYGNTSTLPNHTSMVTSRSSIGKYGHAITINKDDGGSLDESIMTVFDTVKENGGSTALYATKEKFNVIARSVNDVLDVSYINDGDDLAAVREFTKDFAQDPSNLSFVHLYGPDHAGHEHGFMSDGYLQTVEDTANLLQEIITTVETNESVKDNVTVIVTSDHGGMGDSHGDIEDPDNYTIPFFVWGSNLESGNNIYELNPDDLKDPKGGRPSLEDPNQPVRNGDVGNLAVSILYNKDIPGSTINSVDWDDLVSEAVILDEETQEGQKTPEENNKANSKGEQETNVAPNKYTFTVASFNVRGAHHTAGSRPWRSGEARMIDAYEYFSKYGLDVILFQELEKEQRSKFKSIASKKGDDWALHPDKPVYGKGTGFRSPNSIAWNRDVFNFVKSGYNHDLGYLGSSEYDAPWIILEHKETGERYLFYNVHDPANVNGPEQRDRTENTKKHIDFIEYLKKKYKITKVIFGGDLNSTINIRAKQDRGVSKSQLPYCIINSAGYDYAFDTVKRPSYASAKDCKLKSSKEVGPDHIIHSPNVKIEKWQSIGSIKQREISDHELVITKVATN